MSLEIDYQLHRVSVDIAKGFRQLHKASTAYFKDDMDRALKDLNKGLNYFDTALNHIAKAEGDAYDKAAAEIDKGNKELQKSIDAYTNGDVDTADDHYNSAIDDYDKALDLIS